MTSVATVDSNRKFRRDSPLCARPNHRELHPAEPGSSDQVPGSLGHLAHHPEHVRVEARPKDHVESLHRGTDRGSRRRLRANYAHAC